MSNTTLVQSVPTTPVASQRRWWVLVACIIASCARNTDPPPWIYRPPEVQAFNQAWADYNLAMSVFTLATLAFLLSGGVLGDIFGRRRVMLIGLGGLVSANLLALFSPGIAWFVVSRFLAGMSGTLVLPLSLSLLYLAFAEEPVLRTRAIAVYILLTNIAALTAGPLSMLINQFFDWRVTLVVPTLLGMVAFVLVQREVAESRVAHQRLYDVIGHAAWALIVLSGMVTLVSWWFGGSFSSGAFRASLIGLAIGLALLVWWDRRSTDSIFGRCAIKRQALIVLIIYGLTMQFGFVSLITQVIRAWIAVSGYTSVLAVIALAPLLIGMIATTLYASRRLVNPRPRPLLSGALLGGAAICATASFTGAASFYPLLALLLLLFGAAMMLANTTWTAIFFVSMPEDAVGVRTGISSSVFQMGGALGTTITSALLARMGMESSRELMEARGIPVDRMDEVLVALNSILDLATPEVALDPAVRDRLMAGYQMVYLATFNNLLLLIAGVLLVGSLVAWFGLTMKK